jgi:hypothetical protein
MRVSEPTFSIDQLGALDSSDEPSSTNPFLTTKVLEAFKHIKSNTLKIGEISDSEYAIYANIAETSHNPAIKYLRESHTWVFSNDGIDWTSLSIGTFFDTSSDTADSISDGTLKKFLVPGRVTPLYLNSKNSPNNEDVLTWNSSAKKFEWKTFNYLASSMYSSNDVILHFDADGNSEGKLSIRVGNRLSGWKEAVTVTNDARLGVGKIPQSQLAEFNGAIVVGDTRDGVDTDIPGTIKFTGGHFQGYTAENSPWANFGRVFTYNQETPATLWRVVHNLNTTSILMAVQYQTGVNEYEVFLPDRYKIVDLNTVEVYHKKDIAGQLLFIG